MNMEGQFLTNRHFLTFSLRTFVRFSENCWNFNSGNSEHLSIDPYIFYLHYPLRSLRTVGLKDVKNNFGCFVYDVKILALPHLTPRVLEKRSNKVRKRILYTEVTSLWSFIYRKPLLKKLDIWRRKNFVNLIYFSDGLYMTSKYMSCQILPPAFKKKDGIKLEKEFYTPKWNLCELSFTENRF